MPGTEQATELPSGTAEWKSFLRWRWQRRGLVRAHRRRGEALPRVSPHAGAGLDGSEDAAWWVGHASVVARVDGQVVLFDPIWSRNAAHVVPRMTPPAFGLDALDRVDAVCLSHNHYDHMDAATLRRLRTFDPDFLVPRGDGAWFRRRGFRRVVEADWWQAHERDGVRFTFAPARHFSGRTLWDRDRSLWGGWVVEGRRTTVWHAGDTGYGPHFAEVGRRFPRIDLACVPAGAYLPRWFMAPVHVDPDECVRAFRDAGARRLLPIHWGTFRLTDEAMDEPPARVRDAFAREGLDADRLVLGDLGAPVPLGRD